MSDETRPGFRKCYQSGGGFPVWVPDVSPETPPEPEPTETPEAPPESDPAPCGPCGRK